MIFECENVTLGYENKIVTSNLSFTIDKGDYVCIVGENGTGKSTLVKTILGLIKPLEGKMNLKEGKIYMIKHIRICALTVAVLMKSGRKPFTMSHRTIPFQCCTNGGKTVQTFVTSRKPHQTRRTISTDCCVCTLWTKSYYTPFLSSREQDGIFSNRLCRSNTGRFPP